MGGDSKGLEFYVPQFPQALRRYFSAAQESGTLVSGTLFLPPRRSPCDVEGCCMFCMGLHHTSRWARGMVPNPLGERLPCGRIERIILIN